MTTQQKLDEALAARHKLLVGKAAVSLSHGERRLEYSPAQINQLDAYIAELRRELSGNRQPRKRITYVVPQG